jgi:L-alanine-DL-glutamate epimerase-like enolase superfamily enzyme
MHLAASQPHTIAIESFDWLDSVLEQQFEVRDRLAHVPDRPGFVCDLQAGGNS